MHIISTTCGWNLGDDLIREGCFNLLGIAGNNCFFLDRTMLKNRKRTYQYQKNNPSLDELFKVATLFVSAGTPEWYMGDMFSACRRYDIPIIIVGAGMAGRSLQEYKSLIKVATCRDQIAYRTFKNNGIDAEIFLDPAFFCNVTDKKEIPKYDIVMNFRAGCGNGYDTNNPEYIDRFKKIYKQYKNRISIITTHEIQEFITLRSILPDANIFFSSNYRDYKKIYFNCRHYIGGRIHGCIPSYIGGADVHIIYCHPKIGVIKAANSIIPSELGKLNLYNFSKEIKIKDHQNRFIERKKFLSDYFKDCQKYIREKLTKNKDIIE